MEGELTHRESGVDHLRHQLGNDPVVQFLSSPVSMHKLVDVKSASIYFFGLDRHIIKNHR